MHEPNFNAKPSRSILRAPKGDGSSNARKKTMRFSSEALNRQDVATLIDKIIKRLKALQLNIAKQSPLAHSVRLLFQLRQLNDSPSFHIFHRQKELLTVANRLWTHLEQKARDELELLMRAAEEKFNLPKFSLLASSEQLNSQKSTTNSAPDHYIGTAAQPSISIMYGRYQLYRDFGYAPEVSAAAAGITYLPPDDEALINLKQPQEVTTKKDGEKSTVKIPTQLYHLPEYYYDADIIRRKIETSITIQIEKAKQERARQRQAKKEQLKLRQARERVEQIKQALLKHYQSRRIQENTLKGSFFIQKNTRSGQIQKLINIIGLGDHGVLTKKQVINKIDGLIQNIISEQPWLPSTLQSMLEELKDIIANSDMSDNKYTETLIDQFNLSPR